MSARWAGAVGRRAGARAAAIPANCPRTWARTTRARMTSRQRVAARMVGVWAVAGASGVPNTGRACEMLPCWTQALAGFTPRRLRSLGHAARCEACQALPRWWPVLGKGVYRAAPPMGTAHPFGPTLGKGTLDPGTGHNKAHCPRGAPSRAATGGEERDRGLRGGGYGPRLGTRPRAAAGARPAGVRRRGGGVRGARHPSTPVARRRLSTHRRLT